VAAQDERLEAIAAAAAGMLRQTPYHVVRAGDVAAAVRLPGQTGRSAVWLYNEVHSRRVLVALAAAYAWRDFAGQANWSPPGPIGSLTAARSAAVAALGVIVAFHRAEQPLMTQVGYGIGDISTAEKRRLAAGTGLASPSWPDSSWGRVAAAGWHGRCDVFTDFLRPVLRDCAESVTHLAEPDVAESASRLSDVAFRTCLADREGPVELLARGLAALWFERDLTRLAGALPHDLESAETALTAVARRRTDPRTEANASAVVVRVLLEAGTLHRRCIRQAQRTVSLWQNLPADLDGPASSVSDAIGYDLQRLSDAASHLGLAAARYGDRRTAADAWRLSRRVADEGLGHEQSRVARADNNLAALDAETGRAERAGTVIAGVRRARLALLECQPQDAAAWRRLTVTDRTRAEVTRLNGEAVESVRLATALLADRRARLSDPANTDTAEARIILGQALLTAGHPIAARRHLEEAADTRRGRFLPASYRVQEDLIWLAKAALVLGHPRTVIDLLAGQGAETDWFRDQVSFRLGYTARRLLALASSEVGRTDEAAAILLAGREELSDWPLDAGLDPLAADFDRSLAEVALRRGEAAAAAAALARLAEAEAQAQAQARVSTEAQARVSTEAQARVSTEAQARVSTEAQARVSAEAEARTGTEARAPEASAETGGEDGGGPPLPAHGWTLVLLGRAAAKLGDTRRAAECFQAVTDLAARIDPCHPVIMTARYDEAERCTAIGDARQAANLLAPVLDRTLLAHGRPALGEAHPLLARARILAERLGITVTYTIPGLDEASLDIDA
jgi:tetratricopeptide (TPR) repeat protein